MVTIALEAVSVALGGRTVLRDASATLRAGSLVGVIGPNGAGKSTMVRALLGLVRPASGRVTIDGADIAGLRPRAVARAIAYLPQGQTLHWPLSVARLVALGRLPHLGATAPIGPDDRAAIAGALASAGVSHLARRVATQLSGGERSRVMLARALAVGAPALAVDEPLAALDPGHQLDVMELLAVRARAGDLVIAVLHDLTLAARHCDRLVLLDRGAVVADGTPAMVLTPERLRAVYGITARIELAAPALVVPTGRAHDQSGPGSP